MRSLALLVALLGCESSTPGDDKPPDEICDNLEDDDLDDLADCADPDCAAVCGEVCNNGTDDDLDGLIDCLDDDCDGLCPENCGDGRDNDGDGQVDCDDRDCFGSCPEICGDGFDNDGDGKVDCLDEECVDPSCPEACTDGRDNDADGLVDCADDDCVDPSCDEICDDGRDNDADGRVDCDDSDCDGACPEICDDGRDNDADGAVDCEDSECEALCDRDGDGFFDEALGGDDCDDDRADVNPSRPEICNGPLALDDDCDGLVDEDDPDIDPLSLTAFGRDDDVDGYGTERDVILACQQPAGFAPSAPLDCDDSRPEVNPGMPEICNPDLPLDDDCDGLIDDDDPDVSEDSYLEWYADRDGDGWGSGVDFEYACSRPDGTAPNDDDCDDSDPLVGPPTLWYPDADRDGYGAGEPVDPTPTCEPPYPGLRPEWIGLDCDDEEPAIHPGAEEICEDGIDQDCDGIDRRCAGLVLVYSESNTMAEEAALAAGHTVTATNDEVLFVAEYDAGSWDLVIMETPTSGMEAEQIARAIDATDRGIPLIFSWWNLDTDASLQDALGIETVSYDDPPDIVPDPSAPAVFFDGVSTPITPVDDSWGDNGDYLTLTRGGTLVARDGAIDGDAIIALTNDDTTIVNGFLPDNFDGDPDMLRLYQNEIDALFFGVD